MIVRDEKYRGVRMTMGSFVFVLTVIYPKCAIDSMFFVRSR